MDHLTLTGEVVWGRLWGAGDSPIRATPICLLLREDIDMWKSLAALKPSEDTLSTYATSILTVLDQRGASFTQDLEAATGFLPSHFEMGLTQLIGHGLITSDSFGGLRRLITPPSKRRGVMARAPLTPAGRWSRFRDDARSDSGRGAATEDQIEFVARRLLDRYGVVFRKLLDRERIPIPWRDLVRCYRHLELRGDVRGGRFVQRFSGEQFARPEAVELMRRRRRMDQAASRPIEVAAADPLNLQGVLTPEPRIPAQLKGRVQVA